MNIKANNPALRSWISYDENTDFPIQNIPFGIASLEGSTPRVCSIIGNQVIDILTLHRLGHLDIGQVDDEVLEKDSLNDFIALGKSVTNAVRDRISYLFSRRDPEELAQVAGDFLCPEYDVQYYLPVTVGDYTDFYSSREHATNVGTMFRDPENALLPNWLHLPVGYHGRASSIVVTGTDVKRPSGQTKPDDGPPVFGPCKWLDFELEMAFVVGKPNAMGESVSVDKAQEHIFGMLLFNDWSARDIQKWEYVPLGPFLAKNFASTVSPWIVTIEALEAFRVPVQERSIPVLDYLKSEGNNNYDINLFVDIETEDGELQNVSKSNYKYMYWNMSQQLAHHTVNGCNLRVGDMCASGTISGPTPDSYGSMLEISWRGTKPVDMPDGTQRRFINDGDTVSMRGYAQGDGYRIGFGECKGEIIG